MRRIGKGACATIIHERFGKPRGVCQLPARRSSPVFQLGIGKNATRGSSLASHLGSMQRGEAFAARARGAKRGQDPSGTWDSCLDRGSFSASEKWRIPVSPPRRHSGSSLLATSRLIRDRGLTARKGVLVREEDCTLGARGQHRARPYDPMGSRGCTKASGDAGGCQSVPRRDLIQRKPQAAFLPQKLEETHAFAGLSFEIPTVATPHSQNTPCRTARAALVVEEDPAEPLLQGLGLGAEVEICVGDAGGEGLDGVYRRLQGRLAWGSARGDGGRSMGTAAWPNLEITVTAAHGRAQRHPRMAGAEPGSPARRVTSLAEGRVKAFARSERRVRSALEVLRSEVAVCQSKRLCGKIAGAVFHLRKAQRRIRRALKIVAKVGERRQRGALPKSYKAIRNTLWESCDLEGCSFTAARKASSSTHLLREKKSKKKAKKARKQADHVKQAVERSKRRGDDARETKMSSLEVLEEQTAVCNDLLPSFVGTFEADQGRPFKHVLVSRTSLAESKRWPNRQLQ
ncbi:purine-rich element-binding protein gamma isoform X1 [Struthio camelus]|uniref:purine-rich element-binding protein gamma isoform X1 n=1 Tax=Struthio camelus TaxID=8801 RepID=UPI0036040CD0